MNLYKYKVSSGSSMKQGQHCLTTQVHCEQFEISSWLCLSESCREQFYFNQQQLQFKLLLVSGLNLVMSTDAMFYTPSQPFFTTLKGVKPIW